MVYLPLLWKRISQPYRCPGEKDIRALSELPIILIEKREAEGAHQRSLGFSFWGKT
jgi:hypothetical protein